MSFVVVVTDFAKTAVYGFCSASHPLNFAETPQDTNVKTCTLHDENSAFISILSCHICPLNIHLDVVGFANLLCSHLIGFVGCCFYVNFRYLVY